MKKIFSKLLLFGFAGVLFASCEKDEIKAVLNSNANPAVTLSSQNVVLLKDNADKEALTISWAKPDYGFPAGASYTILIDKKGGNFSNAAAFSTGAELKKTFKTGELNAILLKMGLPTGIAADVDIKVESLLGTTTKFSSTIVSMKATPFLDKLDLSTNLGVVGSAANNWGATPDLPFYKTDKANVYVAYVTLIDGEIKFREDSKWDVNYGGSGGTLAKGGDNIAVKAGNYKITVDLNSLKYTIEKFAWGIIGSATPNGWDGPDIKLAFDPNSDTFKAVAVLKEGEMKFRLNQDWSVNYGDTGADGTLDAGGDNIKTKVGTFLITFDLKKNKFVVEPYTWGINWGVVGDATPSGWNGPDTKFPADFANEGLFEINTITLKTGEIKFRLNDAWDKNYGGANGLLKDGGDNIKVTAGTYSIAMDLKKLTYSLTKK